MENIQIKNSLLMSLAKRYGGKKKEIERVLKVTGVDLEYYELVCELLGVLLGKVVWLMLGDDEHQEGEDSVMIKKGSLFNLNSLLNIGYERVERVWNEGEISVLGDVILIWPFSMNNLIRISLSGDDIEGISVVEVESRKRVKDIEGRTLLGKNSKLLVGNEESSGSVKVRMVEDIERQENLINLGLRNIPNVQEYTSRKAILEIVRNFKSRGYDIWYLSNSIEKYDLLVEKELKESISEIFSVNTPLEKSLKKGFVSSEAKVLLLTDLEVLGQIDLSIYEERNIKMDPGSVEILKKLVPGDYVVHEDHGIGRFVDVVRKEKGSYIEIAYAGKDRLYIPLTASEKITKFIGVGRERPTLTGLGSGVWKRISKKVKKEVENIARELLQLYALRETSKTEILLKDEDALGELNTFVKQFEFDDTDDQVLSTEHIVNDFQNSKPMDRLLVGDVGYGKTEIASRAMFVAVNSGYQVALLAPTTILVEQHRSVLMERFKNYPFVIESLSRFSSEKKKEQVLRDLKKGSIDIVVGTHSLLSEGVVFKNLGLLIVDEEQKFGVKQKENIKSKRIDTNVLSLTATPIPRTLNMALMGIRDISVLATPPLGRKEVINYFGKFDWNTVKDAVAKELKRNGQVYYLHNRVNTIEYSYSRLVNMFPHANIAIAHGQMSVQRLSSTMKKFVNEEIDILVCTTIIENGLDIPSVNTLIIDDATMLGLSQMYQIRGRIGRSERQGYAYFLFENLRGNAQLRLEALRESQELGSGFLLSNKDLEIRGAGDILGKNQSGTINSVGYGLYSVMLKDAIEKLKNMNK
ncbi:MAG: DEAD/DEAH box helicase [Candidatus Dojkabacteria bacterium]